MKVRERIVPFLIVLGAIGLGVSGCSESRLDSGSQSLGVVFAPSPAGTGRFERGAFDIQKLQIIPTDPLASQVYGTESLQLRFTEFVTDLNVTQPVAFSQIALAQGNYQVTYLKITHPALVDNNLPAPPYPSCMEGVAAVNVADIAGVPQSTEFFNPPLTFTVRPGQTTLSIKMNIPAFIAAFEAAFTCQTGCGSAGTNCVVAPFDETAYRTAVLANLTIE